MVDEKIVGIGACKEKWFKDGAYYRMENIFVFLLPNEYLLLMCLLVSINPCARQSQTSIMNLRSFVIYDHIFLLAFFKQ